MPDSAPQSSPAAGQRIAVRYRDEEGDGELIGFVEALDAHGLLLRDRRLEAHLLAPDVLVAWRAVPQVPRGRDPRMARREVLDRMAGDDWFRDLAPAPGPCQVARLCDVLGPRVPTQSAWQHDASAAAGRDGQPRFRARHPGGRAISLGEWATVVVDAPGPSGVEVVRALARWAAFRDARSIQVRGASDVLPGFEVLGD